MCVYVCMCTCVCVWERERFKQKTETDPMWHETADRAVAVGELSECVPNEGGSGSDVSVIVRPSRSPRVARYSTVKRAEGIAAAPQTITARTSGSTDRFFCATR